MLETVKHPTSDTEHPVAHSEYASQFVTKRIFALCLSISALMANGALQGEAPKVKQSQSSSEKEGTIVSFLKEIERCIQDLSNDSYEAREVASEELLKIFEKILQEQNPPSQVLLDYIDRITTETKKASPETHIRLQTAMKRFDHIKYRTPERVAPMNGSASEVLKKIEHLTGFSFIYSEDVGKKLMQKRIVTQGSNDWNTLFVDICREGNIAVEGDAKNPAVLYLVETSERQKIFTSNHGIAFLGANRESINIRLSPAISSLITINTAKRPFDGSPEERQFQGVEPDIAHQFLHNIHIKPNLKIYTEQEPSLLSDSFELRGKLAIKPKKKQLSLSGSPTESFGFQEIRTSKKESETKGEYMVLITVTVFPGVPWPQTTLEEDMWGITAAAMNTYDIKDSQKNTIHPYKIERTHCERSMECRLFCSGEPTTLDIQGFTEICQEQLLLQLPKTREDLNKR